ncbi:MAG TPA: SusD/RagB family nutrient-binding outer membrane lipoprotein [Chitinophagaceae bacterium]|nr:SusD/RagB family nutrient-binding outer membrane lipoprotein [Chitinophagaceae bacterium]
MKAIQRLFKTRIPVAVVLCSFLFSACTKKFGEINTDRNSIATVGSSELPFLFAKAENTAIPNIWRYQVAQNLFADQYAQYFACAATYFPSDRLVMRFDWVSAAFDPIYTDMVPQLQSILTSSDPSSAENALANIVWVLGFHRVTDYWGPIPYSQAGIPGNSVAYDAQDQIYDDFFKRLTAAVDVLKSHSGETPFGSYDLIYGGDVNKWIKFANTLRLRLAIRISKVDPSRAKTEAEAAVASGVLTTSPGEDALVQRSLNGSDYNGLSIMSEWNEFRMSAAMESALKGYSDPRMPVYFCPTEKDGTFQGLRNGLTSTQLVDPVNKSDANSHVGPRWASQTYPTGTAGYLTTPQNVMCAAEAYFLRAEGALLGWSMNGTAKDLYESGIRNSMYQWGITDDAAITSYINSSSTPVAPQDYLNSPPVSTVPVKFAGDLATQRIQIALQKWLALFPDGCEAWADYRRGRYFILYPVANSDNADIPDPTTQWIRRIPFLPQETDRNADGVSGAAQLLGGPDKVTTPLWWDKN